MLKRYRSIIIDPPWAYDAPRAIVGNGGRGSAGAASIVQADVNAHYETMTLDELKKLRLPHDKECLLFLWTTNPFLSNGDAVSLVKHWEFEPKTVLTWSKVQADGVTPSMKTGHWFRSASEHVVFAVKGRVRRPEDFPALPTWFSHKRLPHSVKPDTIHEYAEKAMPEGPWLEMFARRPRDGWDTWGNQAPNAVNLKQETC